MKKKIIAVIAACLLAAVLFAGCGSENRTVISVSDDGYITVNGDKTDVKIDQDVHDGEDGKPGEDGKSAYELYLEANPMYEGDESQWLADLTSGKLASRKEYSIVSYGRNLAASVQTGSVTCGPSAVELSGAVLALSTPVILPLGETSRWSVKFQGTLMPGGAGGGQILTSYPDGTEGRVYLGMNYGNQALFLGVNVSGKYANYCWSVSKSELSADHAYEITYENGEFSLSLDGGEIRSITSVNIDQGNITAVESGKAASAELADKIRAVTGQDFVKMTHIGAKTHLCTNRFEYFGAETSSVYGYEELAVHPLKNKTVYYLGSSVTRGHGGDTDGTSFADMAAVLTGNSYRKEAISGTYLAVDPSRNNSYVERLAKFDFSERPDALVFQLSTNDFSNGIPIGRVGNGTASSSFDTGTVTGAIEYIIAKVRESSPGTKVILYTCTVNSAYAKYDEYQNYIVGTLEQVGRKWADTLTVLDAFHARYVNTPAYMQADGVHPTKAGFAHVYTPLLVNRLTEILH